MSKLTREKFTHFAVISRINYAIWRTLSNGTNNTSKIEALLAIKLQFQLITNRSLFSVYFLTLSFYLMWVIKCMFGFELQMYD